MQTPWGWSAGKYDAAGSRRYTGCPGSPSWLPIPACRRSCTSRGRASPFWPRLPWVPRSAPSAHRPLTFLRRCTLRCRTRSSRRCSLCRSSTCKARSWAHHAKGLSRSPTRSCRPFWPCPARARPPAAAPCAGPRGPPAPRRPPAPRPSRCPTPSSAAGRRPRAPRRGSCKAWLQAPGRRCRGCPSASPSPRPGPAPLCTSPSRGPRSRRCHVHPIPPRARPCPACGGCC
mmetsp:Transcript_124826/g.312161  ORF Transcript_124826/g.312161 Transcript_124826/m.312161 type:complete len:230 (-) Transcript_124826:4632-5321(-)